MDKVKSRISKLIKSKEEIKNICVEGWIRTKRVSKKLTFIELNDGSCLENLQVIIDNGIDNYYDIKKITLGSALCIDGSLVKSIGQGQKWELISKHIEILGISNIDFPLQKKKHSDEFLRSISHLRSRTNKYGAIFRIRSSVFFAIHDFFRNKNFYYVTTPIITASDCEGAGDMFRVNHLNNRIDKNKNIKFNFYDNFFGLDANLTVSGQLSAEMFALSLGSVYTFGPTFRAEKSNTSRHISEFWMLEPEMAFYNIDDNVRISEELIKFLVNFVLTNCESDFAYLSENMDKDYVKMLENIVLKEFICIEYKDIIKILLKSNKKFSFGVEYGLDLQSEHERYITDIYFKKPVVIINYPKNIKPFYMRLNEDKNTVAAMDLLVPRIGELIGGSQREERLDLLIKRMDKMSIVKSKYWWYLDSRCYGSVIHSGFGMGFERFLMLVTGASNIRDVIPFPRNTGNIEF